MYLNGMLDKLKTPDGPILSTGVGRGKNTNLSYLLSSLSGIWEDKEHLPEFSRRDIYFKLKDPEKQAVCAPIDMPITAEEEAASREVFTCHNLGGVGTWQ